MGNTIQHKDVGKREYQYHIIVLYSRTCLGLNKDVLWPGTTVVTSYLNYYLFIDAIYFTSAYLDSTLCQLSDNVPTALCFELRLIIHNYTI